MGRAESRRLTVDVQGFLERLQKVRPNKDGWTALCPGHEDKSPSLSIGEGTDGRILLHCHAGCPTEQVVAAMGLALSDLMPETEERHRGAGTGKRPSVGDDGPIGRIEAVYEYPDKDGVIGHLVARYRTKDEKSFRPFHRTDDTTWKMGAGSSLWPLYRLPDLQEALAMERTVWIVEGEKCADAVVEAGLTATTSHGGANGWKAEYAEELRGADLIVCPDHDEPGEAYAEAVVSSVRSLVHGIRVLRLPGLAEHEDVADYLARGKTGKDLYEQALSTPELPVGLNGGAEYVPPEGLWMSFDDVMAERAGIGQRYGTGLPLLDAKLDGGLYAGTLNAIQGGPGLGKTALATQIGLHLAAQGCSVACYFGDEGNNGAFVTVCQQLGVPRSAAMENNREGVSAARKIISDYRWFRLVRPSHKEATLERMVEGLVRLSPNDAPRVLLIDSAQVLRLTAEKSRESPVERVQRAIHLLRDLTLQHQLITLLVSRVHRGAFGKKKEEETVDPIAAAWGGATEWLAELIVALVGKPPTPEAPKVTVEIAKNRISVSGTWRFPLLIDWKTKRFLEVDPAAEEAEKKAANVETISKVKEKIRHQLVGRDGVPTTVLKKEVGGKGTYFVQARQEMAEEGLIHVEKRKGHGGKEEWFLGPPPDPGSPAARIATWKDPDPDLFDPETDGEK